MKLIDAINQVDKSNPQWAQEEAIWQALHLNYYEGVPSDIYERLKAYWLIKWLCTDTWVGLQVFYFDDKPVAVTSQTARKSDLNVEFVSKEMAEQLRQYLLTATEQQEYPVIDPDEFLEEFYTVTYSSQLLVKEGYYKGQPVKVVKEYSSMSDIANWRYAVVENEAKEAFKIGMEEFHIPLHLENK